MNNQNFTTTLLVDQTPKETFDAINNVRGWWSEEIEGDTDKLHDEFTYHNQDIHHCKMKLIEVIPGEKVVWLVTDNYFNFTQDKSEWIGTKISFEIAEQGTKTQLRFTHWGLVPEYECYGVCSNAWSGYINHSLRSLITTGKGQPNPKEGETEAGRRVPKNEDHLKIAGKVVLVTGANRGIGRALVEEALRRGAKRVYAGTRVPYTHPDERVTPLTLDVTNADQIQKAVEQVESLDILINNAGVALYDDLSNRAMLERHLAVNLFGTYELTQAFLPLLIHSQGALVNVLSVAALAPLPPIASYSISKAAAFSLTQSLRAFLVGRGVSVHAVLTGPVDTDMNRGLDIPKASPESAAYNIFDGVEKQEEDIFPDPMSRSLAESWNNGAVKAFEKQNAAFVVQ